MNLYRISQSVNRKWDTYSDAIVQAENEIEASNIHPNCESEFYEPWPYIEDSDSYDRGDWADCPEQVKVEFIGVAVEGLIGKVICASYHAG